MIVKRIIQFFGRWPEGLVDAKAGESKHNGHDAEGNR